MISNSKVFFKTDTLLKDILPRRIAGLTQLAYNLWWSWHLEARDLFKVLDRPLWKTTGHNPVQLLQRIAPHRLVEAAQDSTFLQKYDSVMRAFEADTTGTQTWLDATHSHLKDSIIAYFSMEFAFHSSLPLYAGGLGVLAGDYCKEASDLGLPVVGVGFMYAQGYFQQRIDGNGWQEEAYPQLDFAEIPMKRLFTADQQIMKLVVELDSRSVCVGVWQVNVGRATLYLLDTDLEENPLADRQLSARLYGGDHEIRLEQEILLGIGGVRVLRAIGVSPKVWHANEGHAAFMMLERCRELVEKGLNFNEALSRVQASTVFTTHTPVPSGNDTFATDLVDKYFHRYWVSLGLDRDAFLALGTQDSNSNSYNMTILGLRMCNQRNGVSHLHGVVCQRMWHSLWPGVEEGKVPIGSVTNGIHVPTWVAPQMARLYERYLGAGWLSQHDDPRLWERVESIPDEEIWSTHQWLKRKLVASIRDRVRKRWRDNHGSAVQTVAMGAMLDAEALTLVFSRRFTDYKRALLVLRDINRLKRMVQDDLEPIQIVFSGKAHPDDQSGKQLIQQVYDVAKDPEFNGRIAFVEDYDLHMARYFVHGADVWLNTPRPLQEASGTSGMKAALNGVLHLSALDGWWCEAYDGANGWAIHSNGENTDSVDQDVQDANTLYRLLEEKIIPLYYCRGLDGVPHEWVRMVKRAILSIVPMFSTRRMVKEYTERLYFSAAQDT